MRQSAKIAAAELATATLGLASCHGMTPPEAARLADHVYGQPPGRPAQECGGVAVSLLAYHHAAGTSQREAERAASPALGAVPPPDREPGDGPSRQARMAAWVEDIGTPTPPGQAEGLSGRVSALLLLWSEAHGTDVRSEEGRELSRIESKPKSHFAPRQAAKAAAGIITKVD